MSFALTAAQFLDGSKTVTRRKGWSDLKPGTCLWAVRKSMGLKKGEKVERLGVIRVLANGPERLDTIDADDVRREGFPEMSPSQFVVMFCRHIGGMPDQKINRIEFERYTP